jgi:uncharacterized OB-fold protein
MADEVLTAPLVLEYPFTRTTGPVIGGFLTGLREGVIHGVRRSDGTVMCPPLEYDPITAAPLSELVAVGTVGTVTTWTWNGEPRAQQPFTQPFAWAMITLDGADTPMLHAVFVDSADDMATGMRVEVVWRDEREGHITDIVGFIPAVASTNGEPAAMPSDVEQIQSVRTPIRMEYTYTPGRALSQYLRAMKDKRILGDKCPETGEVSVPPRGVSSVAGKPTLPELVDLPDTGYIESFNITRVPIKMRPDLTPPYVSAWIVLDGASVGFMGLGMNVEPEDVRVGMRVRAVWKPDDELEMSAQNILGWEPTGEPDEVITDYARVGRLEQGGGQ